MKTTFRITKYFILVSLLLQFACSSDDDSPGIIPLTVQNLIASVDENQANGASVGTMSAIGQGVLSFSITSQTPAGALDINAITGALTVADASAFDFETNPVINATVSVVDLLSTATATVVINLNDIDGIESLLSTSEAAYGAAADGDWVVITEAEYNTLSSSINLVTKTGMSDTNYDMGPTGSTFVVWTFVNVGEPTMPIGSYVFAIKYNLTSATTNDIKMKQSSTSVSTGYENLGNTIVGGEAGDNYAVLKGSDLMTTDTGYLAIYDSSTFLGFRTITGISLQNGSAGDTNDLPNNQSNSAVYYQGLSTTQMQW